MNDKNVSGSSRVGIFDFLRIILTILVVDLHIRIIAYTKPNLLEPFVFFTVPLFIVLSFYFMSKYFLKEKVNYLSFLPRIKRVLIPLLFWSIIGFLVHPQLFDIKNILLQIATGAVVNVPLYYLNLLIVFTIIFWLLTYVNLRIRLLIYFCIIFVAFFMQYSFINYNFFNPTAMAIKNSYGRFFELIPYAAVGILFGILALKTKIKSALLFILIILFGLLFIFTINLPQPLGFHFSGINLFSGTIYIFSLTMLLTKLQFNLKLHKLIEILGKYSFGVYLFHFILLEQMLKLFPYLKTYITAHSLLFMVFYASFCYLLCILFNILTLRKLFFLIE
jgi:peptidoglycan/LPS O-acetylase OafA/YrhL